MTKFILGVVQFLYNVVMVAWKAFVIATLWAWFVVPTFGLPVLTIPLILGLDILFSLWTKTPKKSDVEDQLDTTTRNSLAAILPGVALLAGWLIKISM